MTPADPFAALDLRRSGELSDDEVRSAWRRMAASTHPDRGDGGDPDAFAAAAAAYAVLRSSAGRRDALADLTALSGRRRLLTSAMVLARWPGGRLAHRVLRGRPLVLALRVLACAAVSAMVVTLAGWQPASPAIITGALTWLLITGRADVGSRSGLD